MVMEMMEIGMVMEMVMEMMMGMGMEMVPKGGGVVHDVSHSPAYIGQQTRY